MTNVQLLQLAQSAAFTAVTGKASALATAKAAIEAFAISGNAEADWPAFNQSCQRELQNYRQAAQRDAAPAPGAAAAARPGASRNTGIPPEIMAKLAPDVQARLTAQNPPAAPAAAPVAAPAPPPAAPAAS